MTLVPVESPVRLSSPSQIEPLFAALGLKVVATRGWRATDPVAIDRLVTGLNTGTETTIGFDGGALSPAAWESLELLVRGGAGFLDVETPSAALRLWPDRAWVLTMSPAGWIQHDLASADLAVRMFKDVAAVEVRTGSVSGINAEIKRRLPAFLQAIHTAVTATLEMKVRDAVALAAQFPGDPIELQADHVIVQLPELTITKYLVVHPDTDRERAKSKWLAKLAKAMKRAKIG